MEIQSLNLENFGPLKELRLVADGNHITLSGPCGCGKSETIASMIHLLVGKTMLPNDPILHGQESAKEELNIGDGKKIIYTVTGKITKDKSVIKVFSYTADGKRLEIKNAKTFLDGIIYRKALDPQSFFNTKPADQVKMLYDLFPKLESKLADFSKRYIEEQGKRTEANKEKKDAEVKLNNIVITPGLPAEEVDPADLNTMLNEAMGHNDKKTAFIDAVEDFEQRILQQKEASIDLEKDMLLIDDQISQLTAQKTMKAEKRDRHGENIANIKAEKATIERQIAEFKEVPTLPIKEKITTNKATNEQIRANIEAKEHEKTIVAQQKKFSVAGKEMTKIEGERADLIAATKMPIEGLTVMKGLLMYPDPKTGDLTEIDNLSTGQKWNVVISILAAFLPDPDKGLRFMIINDLNSLDKSNYDAIMETAITHNIQYVMHQTVFSTKSDECEITITEK